MGWAVNFTGGVTKKEKILKKRLFISFMDYLLAVSLLKVLSHIISLEILN